MRKIFSKALLFILMIQILNISIYNSHFYNFTPEEIVQNKHIADNPIDSFAELILEEFVGIDNAIPEQERQNDHQSAVLKNNILSPQHNAHYFPELKFANIDFSENIVFIEWKNHYKFDYYSKIIQPPILS